MTDEGVVTMTSPVTTVLASRRALLAPETGDAGETGDPVLDEARRVVRGGRRFDVVVAEVGDVRRVDVWASGATTVTQGWTSDPEVEAEVAVIAAGQLVVAVAQLCRLGDEPVPDAAAPGAWWQEPLPLSGLVEAVASGGLGPSAELRAVRRDGGEHGVVIVTVGGSSRWASVVAEGAVVLDENLAALPGALLGVLAVPAGPETDT